MGIRILPLLDQNWLFVEADAHDINSSKEIDVQQTCIGEKDVLLVLYIQTITMLGKIVEE